MRTDVEGNPIAREFPGSGLTKEERDAELAQIGPILNPEQAVELITKTQRMTVADRKAADALVRKNVDRSLLRDLHGLVAKMKELAEGVYYEEEIKTRTGPTIRRVYKSKPDRQAIEYLIDRILGTPTKVSDSKIKTDTEVKILSVTLNGNTPQPPTGNAKTPVLHHSAKGHDDA